MTKGCCALASFLVCLQSSALDRLTSVPKNPALPLCSFHRPLSAMRYVSSGTSCSERLAPAREECSATALPGHHHHHKPAPDGAWAGRVCWLRCPLSLRAFTNKQTNRQTDKHSFVAATSYALRCQAQKQTDKRQTDRRICIQECRRHCNSPGWCIRLHPGENKPPGTYAQRNRQTDRSEHTN